MGARILYRLSFLAPRFTTHPFNHHLGFAESIYISKGMVENCTNPDGIDKNEGSKTAPHVSTSPAADHAKRQTPRDKRNPTRSYMSLAAGSDGGVRNTEHTRASNGEAYESLRMA
jgi:hypothetical protein